MHLEVHFDYSSPFAYLGTTQVERIASAHGAAVDWRPFLLGALFNEIGTPLVPLDSMPAPKRFYMVTELDRWAAHWQVPFRFASRFPLRTVSALRLTLLAPEARRGALIHALMRACWVDDRDPEDAAVLTDCARSAEIDPALVARVGEPEAKDALRRATAGAVAAGVPGAPTFIAEGMLFWGQDRLGLVERVLAGWRPANG